MDRCSRCQGTGSRFLVVVKEQAFYFPNTKGGWDAAVRKLEQENG